MNTRPLWSRIPKVVGGIAMLMGTLDPLEGSMLILPGSGLVALGVIRPKLPSFPPDTNAGRLASPGRDDENNPQQRLEDSTFAHGGMLGAVLAQEIAKI